MESEKWTMVFSSSRLYQVEILKGLLEENDIPCFIINKQDSSYLFGEIELYVSVEDSVKALNLINHSEIE